MRNEKYFEIFFTTDNVTEYSWLNFLSYVSKLNGIFKKWKIYNVFEKNIVRYFIKTSKEMPTTLGDLNDFLLKKVESIPTYPKRILKSFYFMIRKQKSIIDVYDRNESKFLRKIYMSELTIFPFKVDNYFTFTNIIFKNKNESFIHKKVLFSIPHFFLNIDFSKHTRFLYKKDIKKYLNIEKTVELFESDRKNSILKIDAFPYLQDDYYLNLNKFDFDKHSCIIGGSGTGKSKFLSLLVKNIYDNPNYKMKYKIVIIDPHASIEKDIGGLENTKIIDFKSKENSMDLFINSNENLISESEILLSLFKNLMASEYNSKLERVLRHSIYLLMSIEKVNFKNLRNLVTDNEFRNKILKENREILPDAVTDFFLREFNDLKNKSHAEAISPIISFIDEMSILPLFEDEDKLVSLEKIIDENFLSIVSLDEAYIGEKMTKTISSLIIGQIFSITQKRAFNEHIIFIIDEVSVVQNPIIKRFLAESRKYNVSLILSGQYFNQIEDDLQKAIFANIINYYTFRVSREDAALLAKNMQMEAAVHDSYYVKIKMLTDLANRECVVRVSQNGRVLPAFKAKTLNMNSIPRVEEKYDIDINKKFSVKQEIKNTKNFLINGNIKLKDIMSSQSTGRRRIIDER